jgi:hypothetical protein
MMHIPHFYYQLLQTMIVSMLCIKGKGKYMHMSCREKDDLYDASYEMDPFDIDTPVDTIPAFASKSKPRPDMKEKVCMPKDKWFGLDQNTKEL